MKHFTLDRQSDVELVATILGRQTHDEACTRLATVLATDGWLGGAPPAEVLRQQVPREVDLARAERRLDRVGRLVAPELERVERGPRLSPVALVALHRHPLPLARDHPERPRADRVRHDLVARGVEIIHSEDLKSPTS